MSGRRDNHITNRVFNGRPLCFFMVLLLHQYSLEAYRRILPDLGDAQNAVYSAIRAFPGITRQEITLMVGMPINGVCGRVKELCEAGFIVEDGFMINPVSGKKNAKLYGVE